MAHTSITLEGILYEEITSYALATFGGELVLPSNEYQLATLQPGYQLWRMRFEHRTSRIINVNQVVTVIRVQHFNVTCAIGVDDEYARQAAAADNIAKIEGIVIAPVGGDHYTINNVYLSSIEPPVPQGKGIVQRTGHFYAVYT